MSDHSEGGPEGPPGWEKAIAGFVAGTILGLGRLVFAVFSAVFRILLSFV